MRDPRDYHLDLSSAAGVESPADQSPSAIPSRPYISILFTCCNAYLRIYRNSDATAYRGNCPHCGRSVTLRIGPNGTPCRFFRA